MGNKWTLKGHLLGQCSCDWGCPCSFNARPTKGYCDGGYIWNVTMGNFGGVKLDGLTFAVVGHSPGPLHEGNVTWLPIIDERATAPQREAILKLLEGKSGGPWTVFAAVAGKILAPIYAPFDVTINGLHSKARAGSVLVSELADITNPVTGEAERLQLRKPTGFTSTWADLGKTVKFKIASPDLTFDESGQYGEYAEFDYSGTAPN
ncbi:MAG TPA: DUF1326 domain-containing protein [Candidatus Binataceae bacterium]|nr:DUF1326 domain-containing protein [Candidatus Binataceae bacterium]